MDITRESLVVAIRRVGLIGSVESGMFDALMADNSKDFTQDIVELKEKDTSQDTQINTIGLKADGLVTETNLLDQRVTTLENTPGGTDYSTQITELRNTDIVHDTRLSSIEGDLLNTAKLVSGKVPYENLPEFPVGRKVNVANRAGRLALPIYTDLTIAYESDSGDAWGLDANANPAIDANWSKLGNSMGVGVASFNGRTGNIGPMTGDYNTSQISEIVDKQFVTGEQIIDWTSKETTIGSQTKANNAKQAAIDSSKTYADNTFIPLSQKGVNGGLAPLGSDSKVPIANLPSFIPQTKRVWRDAKATRSVGTWVTNTSKNEMEVHVRASLAGAPANRFISFQIRESAGSTVFVFNSTVLTNVGTGGLTYADSNTITVPEGWQYQLTTTGGSTNALTERWYELY